MSDWLAYKYIQLLGPQLELFKQVKGDVWNFRCPICGDSPTDKTKKRGYIFQKEGEYRYWCHRCGASQKLAWFIKNVNPALFQEYSREKFAESHGGKRERRKPTISRSKKRTDLSKRVELSADYKPEIMKPLKSIYELPDGHLMKEYVISRGIPKRTYKRLYYAENMKEVANLLEGYEDKKFDKFPRLVMPFINREGVVTHIQGRAVGENIPSYARYYTLENIPAPKVFGLETLVDKIPTVVVEGPIDSLFLPNCVGMGGADVPWHLFDPDNTIFAWDNEPRSEQIIKRMKSAIDRGFRVTFWSKRHTEKDINDMILFGGESSRSIHEYILSNSKKGLSAKAALTQFSRI